MWQAGTTLTTGDLTALFSYAIQILMSLMMLSMVFAMMTIAQSSAERISELLQETSDIQNPKDPVRQVRGGSICYQNVDYVYASKAGKKGIDQANVTIQAGQTVGIIGGTGS